MIKYKQPYFAVKIYYEKKYWLQGLIKFIKLAMVTDFDTGMFAKLRD